MSNKRNEKGFYINIAIIAVLLAAIIYIVVSGSKPKDSGVPGVPGADVENQIENNEAADNTEAKAEVEAADSEKVNEADPANDVNEETDDTVKE